MTQSSEKKGGRAFIECALAEWPENHQIFQRIAQKVAKSKKAKISTIQVYLKTQNIYIKPLLEPESTYNKPCFETAYLGKNVINLLK